MRLFKESAWQSKFKQSFFTALIAFIIAISYRCVWQSYLQASDQFKKDKSSVAFLKDLYGMPATSSGSPLSLSSIL